MVSAATLYLLHLGAFGVAAVACFVSAVRVRRIDDVATRRGLVGLLVLCGGWGAAHVAYLLAPTDLLQEAAYAAGLLVGFAAVFAWLYFCSAYTSRTYHRRRTYRLTGLGLLLVVSLVKLTNPLHGAYYSTAPSVEPFPHLAIHVGTLHWTTMGLAYALSFVGYFMLLELIEEVDVPGTAMYLLLGLTALPVTIDLLSPHVSFLITITYEPLGVAAFGVGIAFLYHERFRSIRLTAERPEPTIVVDSDGYIREVNQRARALFNEHEFRTGGQLTEMLPAAAVVFEGPADEEPVIDVPGADGVRYYRIDREPIGSPQAKLGHYIVFHDVTPRERYRRELERQNERLEAFATIVSHDLRNPLTVAKGRLEMAMDADTDLDKNLQAADEALDRMEALIDDVLAIARDGRPVEETESVTLFGIVDGCWEMVDTGAAELVVESDLRFEAEPDRLRRLFENLFRNAMEHAATPEGELTVRVGATENRDGFYVADNGPGIDPDSKEQLFEPGFTTHESGTGFGLAIVKEIAEAHGWTISVTDAADGGARFEIDGVDGETK